MRRSLLVRSMMTVASILILIGVFLMAYMMLTSRSRNVINIDLDSGQSLPITGLDLVPGDSREYAVRLKSSSLHSCTLSMRFVDGEGNTLKNFVRVKILSGDVVVCDELLADVFESGAITLPVDFGSKKNTELKIVYYLPLEVGNEAKNAVASFEVRFTASNE